MNAIQLWRPALDTVYCMAAETLLGTLPDNYVDLIVTSPPYDNLRTYNGFTWQFETVARESYRVLKAGGVMVWVVGDAVVNGSETLTSLRQAIHFQDVVGFRVHDTMIFHSPGTTFPDPTRYAQQFEYMFVLSKGKPKAINLQLKRNKWAGDRRPPGSTKTQQEPDGSRSVRVRKPVKEFGVFGNVWTIGTGAGKSTTDKIAFQHPAIFPEQLAERHIRTWSNPGDIVLDYFVGSGTTAKTARRNNRHYIGCDISAEYVDMARQRLALPYMQNMFERLEATP